jgi:cytochrome c
MKAPRAIATTLLLTISISAAGHAADRQQDTSVLLVQADQGPAPGGYDPMAPRPNPQPIDPMMPSRPAAPTKEGSDVALNPEYGYLPDTPGVEETFYLCTACHSTAIIKQQRLPPSRWDYLWTWMIEKQGMPEQDPETKQTVLSYLKRHFSWKE